MIRIGMEAVADRRIHAGVGGRRGRDLLEQLG